MHCSHALFNGGMLSEEDVIRFVACPSPSAPTQTRVVPRAAQGAVCEGLSLPGWGPRQQAAVLNTVGSHHAVVSTCVSRHT